MNKATVTTMNTMNDVDDVMKDAMINAMDDTTNDAFDNDTMIDTNNDAINEATDNFMNSMIAVNSMYNASDEDTNDAMNTDMIEDATNVTKNDALINVMNDDAMKDATDAATIDEETTWAAEEDSPSLWGRALLSIRNVLGECRVTGYMLYY